MSPQLSQFRRVVLKVGSALLVDRARGRLNHAWLAALAEAGGSLADVVRQHRYEHARTLLETACQEAAQLRDYFPVLKRFLCQPT